VKHEMVGAGRVELPQPEAGGLQPLEFASTQRSQNMVPEGGIEPPASRLSCERSAADLPGIENDVVLVGGIEPPTSRLSDGRSIPLSYTRRWLARPDSNRRPRPSHGRILPLNYGPMKRGGTPDDVRPRPSGMTDATSVLGRGVLNNSYGVVKADGCGQKRKNPWGIPRGLA
jgi:hypothetical protein